MSRIGQIIGGRYRLAHVIGEGAMGEVYRARLEADGHPASDAEPAEVAVKLLRPERSRDPEAVERFLAEVHAMRALSHPSIVRILDAGETEGGQPYVVMDLLGGQSLRGLLYRHGRVDRGTALSVVLPVLEALAAAHEHGVIHRDVKPENIQVLSSRDATAGRRAQVVVLDFGIAKVLDASLGAGHVGHKTTAGMVVGTPGYFAPEQAIGETRIDGRVDLFAVGAVLFELLTGRRAFDGTSPVAIATHVVSDDVPRLASLEVDAPRELQDIVDRALAKKADARFPSAREFARVVADLAPGELGRRILLDSWLASAAIVHPESMETQDTEDTRPTATTDEARDALDTQATQRREVAPRAPLLVCEPTLKSEADPLNEAVSARASSLRPAVHVVEAKAAVKILALGEEPPVLAGDGDDDDDEDEEDSEW